VGRNRVNLADANDNATQTPKHFLAKTNQKGIQTPALTRELFLKDLAWKVNQMPDQ